MNILNKVKNTNNTYTLFKPGETILVGVSGGGDSIALLNILCQLRHELNIKLIVGHINHGLRKSADRDETFVKKVCEKLNVPCVFKKVVIEKQRGKSSIEELAREKRLTALIAMAKRRKIKTIALGHHRDDQAETVLMRILRGTGLAGLQGILPKRIFNSTTIVRPLINCERHEITTFLKKKKLPYADDPTNRDTKHLRNKIRHHLLPLLRKNYNTNVAEVLSNLAQTSTLDYDYLDDTARKYFKKELILTNPKKVKIPFKKMTQHHLSLQRLLFRMSYESLKGSTRRLTIKNIKELESLLATPKNSSVVQLPEKIKARKANGYIIFEKP